MPHTTVQLLPHPSSPPPPRTGAGLALEAHLDRRGPSLHLAFQLRGADTVVLPDPSSIPQRRHELWRRTCFELFLAKAGDEAYHEVNTSPSGDWNVYRFRGYREGMAEEEGVAQVPVTFPASGAGGFRLEAVLDLEGLGLGDAELILSPTAVLEHADGTVSYWAGGHGGKPDFHARGLWGTRV